MKRSSTLRLVYLVIMLAALAIVLIWLAPQYLDLLDRAPGEAP